MSVTSLTQLKDKWFLSFPSDPRITFPPSNRHPGSQVSPSTDGNFVTALIDGQDYMQQWYDAMTQMTRERGGELYHSGLYLNDVHLLGETTARTTPGTSSLDVIEAAFRAGVELHILLSADAINGIQVSRSAVNRLDQRSISDVEQDGRFPTSGSAHQKFSVMKGTHNVAALLGSIEIATMRWDTHAHDQVDADRPPGVSPTHELGVRVQGPAVRDIELSFRERWNDASEVYPNPFVVLPRPPIISTPVSDPDPLPTGTQSVQVLHTYGRTSSGYTWARNGEFTIWASRLNAIQRAQQYIYIEDQYFTPFGNPPLYAGSDLIYQLGQALDRGVKLFVVVPRYTEEPSPIRGYQLYQRDLGVSYLSRHAGADSLIVATLENPPHRIFVHAKLMICDDEFVQVGSANFNQRSMTNDSEIALGIVDGNSENPFPRQLRRALWAHHLRLPLPELVSADADVAFADVVSRLTSGDGTRMGKLRYYSPGLYPIVVDLNRISFDLAWFIIDPYGGPSR